MGNTDRYMLYSLLNKYLVARFINIWTVSLVTRLREI